MQTGLVVRKYSPVYGEGVAISSEVDKGEWFLNISAGLQQNIFLENRQAVFC